MLVLDFIVGWTIELSNGLAGEGVGQLVKQYDDYIMESNCLVKVKVFRQCVTFLSFAFYIGWKFPETESSEQGGGGN